MNYFEVNYIQKGKRDKVLIKAKSRRDAIAIAQAKISSGTILKAYEVSAPLEDRFEDFKDKVFGGNKKKVNTQNLIAAIRQLAVMTNAGISIHDSIKEVGKATVDKQLKEIFEDIDEDLNAGKSLTDAFLKYRNQFGDVTIAMIELGESTGNMSDALTKLADLLQEMEDNANKLKAALRYPKIVMSAIAIAFTILMMYVVPKFKEIFEKLGADLPMPTKILLFLEHALNTYGLYILLTLIAMIMLHKYKYKSDEGYKRTWDKHILKVYLIGDVIFYASLSRFMLIFTELVRAGIPVAEALDTSVMTIDNEDLKDKLSMVKHAVGRGSNLTEAFEDTQIFEGMLIQMIRAGEQGGALDQMLEKVTDYYREKFNYLIDNMSAYIEPIMIGFIAGMVLMLALGIFLPMWDMGQAVKGG
ncbi:MAG: type II secretion system F family protein [Sulfurospirillum sp.]|nr:MAG: type II secretion system F family protein [Sulfurospirillum sp.]